MTKTHRADVEGPLGPPARPPSWELGLDASGASAWPTRRGWVRRWLTAQPRLASSMRLVRRAMVRFVTPHRARRARPEGCATSPTPALHPAARRAPPPGTSITPASGRSPRADAAAGPARRPAQHREVGLTGRLRIPKRLDPARCGSAPARDALARGGGAWHPPPGSAHGPLQAWWLAPPARAQTLRVEPVRPAVGHRLRHGDAGSSRRRSCSQRASPASMVTIFSTPGERTGRAREQLSSSAR